MKLMIKTRFWETDNIESWRENFIRLSFLMGIFALFNVIIGIWENRMGILIVNGLPFALSIVIWRSYIKYTQNEKN